MVEVPDSTTRYIQSDSGKPTKDLFNWMRNISQQLADISQQLSGTGAGILSGGLPCFSVHNNSVGTAIADATPTVVPFSTEIYDVGSHYASNHWTPPAGKVHLCGAFLATPTSGTPIGAICYVYKNGAPFKQATGTLAFALCQGNIAVDDIANGTDTYTLMAYASSAGAPGGTINGAPNLTWFMGHWISP